MTIERAIDRRDRIYFCFPTPTIGRDPCYFFSLGRFAPYLERPCLRSFTPAVSNVPRMMWYLTPGRFFTRPPRIITTECSCNVTDPWDVGGDFKTRGQPNPSHLPQRRVGFFRGGRVHSGANSAALGRLLRAGDLVFFCVCSRAERMSC